MYDRPNASELITAARNHIEAAIIPLARGHNSKLYFQTLVAVNVLKIVEREMALSPAHAEAEWTRLEMLLGPAQRPDSSAALHDALAERNSALCQAIRAGDHDDNAALFTHLKACTIAQLEVANPKLLSILAAEDKSENG